MHMAPPPVRGDVLPPIVFEGGEGGVSKRITPDGSPCWVGKKVDGALGSSVLLACTVTYRLRRLDHDVSKCIPPRPARPQNTHTHTHPPPPPPPPTSPAPVINMDQACRRSPTLTPHLPPSLNPSQVVHRKARGPPVTAPWQRTHHGTRCSRKNDPKPPTCLRGCRLAAPT